MMSLQSASVRKKKAQGAKMKVGIGNSASQEFMCIITIFVIIHVITIIIIIIIIITTTIHHIIMFYRAVLRKFCGESRRQPCVSW